MPAQTQAPPAVARRQPVLSIRAAGLAGTLLVSACQTFSPDGGMDVVAGIAGPALDKQIVAIRSDEDAATVRATLDRLLKRPLTADAAVQVALLNNRGLQAAYDELADAEARMVGESLPPNPSFSLVRIAGSAELEIERRIVTDILALATLPTRSDIARLRFHQAQLAAALETLHVATQARRAWCEAVAARETVGFLTKAEASAGAAAELAKRLTETGAANKLDRAREQVFHAETGAQLAAAHQRAASAREALIRALGLAERDLAFRLPDTLPALPARARRLPAKADLDKDFPNRLQKPVDAPYGRPAACARSFDCRNRREAETCVGHSGPDRSRRLRRPVAVRARGRSGRQTLIAAPRTSDSLGPMFDRKRLFLSARKGINLDRKRLLAVLAGAAGGAIAIGIMEAFSMSTAFPLMAIPFATSIVTVLGSPAAEPAQPRALIGGHLLSTLVGVLMVKLCGPAAWAAAFAVGLAMVAMHLTRTFHPPAGIDPLVVVVNNMSWSFMLAPVAVGALLLAVFAFVWHNLVARGPNEGDVWPARWW
jgi:hypothetical protein